MPAPTLHLLYDAWIPVVTRSGLRKVIRPCQMTEAIDADAIVDVAWPRPDFRAAQLELLIGLLATAAPPESGGEWQRGWDRPPTPDELAARLAPFEQAFGLDGPGPRFLQDLADLGGKAVPVAHLLIDQPGDNAEDNNTDLFVKRGGIRVLGRSTAAIALFTLQAFAPSGGAGHRTSLRGGGPLTTLALSPARPTLWHLLWLNVVPAFDAVDDGLAQDRLADVFPWLAPTRVSDKEGRPTTLVDIHPAQCFWGMPRRIRIDFESNPGGLACDVTGAVEDVIVRSYRTRPYGVNYQAVSHPLTPTYRLKPSDPQWLPVHPQPGGIAYRHWLSFVQESPLRKPAACVAQAERRLAVVAPSAMTGARIRLVGYDMDNMKARGFVEAERPLLIASDKARQGLEILLMRLVEGAIETARILAEAVGKAKEGAALTLVRECFFRDTEAAFFGLAAASLAEIESAPDDPSLLLRLAQGWLAARLAPEAEKAFDREVPAAAFVDAAGFHRVEALVAARRLLMLALAGHGPSGKRLYDALGLAPPEPNPGKGSRFAKKEVKA